MVEVSTTPPSERYPGRPPEGRLVVIAPTRASCETIEIGVQLTNVETILEREHGHEIRQLSAEGKGFGIVAGTGTGKTLAVRSMAQSIVGSELRVGVVNREREATPDTPNWNVVIVTTGIARRWLQDDLITKDDVVVVDEIHQTSAELELCLALAKRAGCRFIWLSATVDPTFYAEYLDAAAVIESSAFDPARAATVRVSGTLNPQEFLSERFLRHVTKGKRGVAVFVPTRAGTEQVAKLVGEKYPAVFAEYYHGGEPVSKLAPFLEGTAKKPFVLAMTAAGQSALNIRGLDTVVIEDAQFTTLVKKGKNVLTRLPLGANEILQMAGRVHGRVEGGEVYILSERNIDFAKLEPTEPNFQLAGDPERVAMTCADMGVRADELDLPVPLDRIAYRRAVETLERRGLIRANRLTEYGRRVEVLPVDRPWGELLVQSPEALVPVVATCASIESLHRMLRQDNDIGRYVVPGSDHLTTYRIYEDALRTCGTLGSVYGLPRHVFDEEALAEWAEERGVLVRSIEDGALAIASIYRSLDLDLPRHFPRLNEELTSGWQRLVAEVMPFDLVIDEETSWGDEVRVSQNSVCGSYGAVAGSLRYFSDRFGRARGRHRGDGDPLRPALGVRHGGGAGDRLRPGAPPRAAARAPRAGVPRLRAGLGDRGGGRLLGGAGGAGAPRAGGGHGVGGGAPPGHAPQPRRVPRAARDVPPLGGDGAGGDGGAAGRLVRRAHGGGGVVRGVHGGGAPGERGRLRPGGGAGAVGGAPGQHPRGGARLPAGLPLRGGDAGGARPRPGAGALGAGRGGAPGAGPPAALDGDARQARVAPRPLAGRGARAGGGEPLRARGEGAPPRPRGGRRRRPSAPRGPARPRREARRQGLLRPAPAEEGGAQGRRRRTAEAVRPLARRGSPAMIQEYTSARRTTNSSQEISMSRKSYAPAALLALGLAGCAGAASEPAPAPAPAAPAATPAPAAPAAQGGDVAQRLAKYTTVRLTADLSSLSASERRMIPLLIDAAREMDGVYWHQAYGNGDSLLASVRDPQLRRFVEINYGPWDRLENDQPFVPGVGPKPEGANYYPADMTKEEFERAVAAGPAARADSLRSLYTLVRRDPQGRLTAVPFSRAYADAHRRTAEKLRAAAALAEDPGLKRYLELRADALLTDRYQASDLAWMDMKRNNLDLVIGPIETYEDLLFGYKASHEGYVLIKDREWSQRLARLVSFLPALQRGIPVAEQYKRETPGAESELNAYDVVYYSGQANGGSKTIAINLPNDEQVQLQKGTRRLQLKNAMRAKFDQILIPIAQELLAPDQLPQTTFDAFFANVMFHEVAHGLGIKNTINGRGTVREALKERGSSLEEGKADILGLYMIQQLNRQGRDGAGGRPQQLRHLPRQPVPLHPLRRLQRPRAGQHRRLQLHAGAGRLRPRGRRAVPRGLPAHGVGHERPGPRHPGDAGERRLRGRRRVPGEVRERGPAAPGRPGPAGDARDPGGRGVRAGCVGARAEPLISG